MASQGYNAADLTSVLQTLSALSTPANPDNNSYEPSDPLPPAAIVPPQSQPPGSAENRSGVEATSDLRARAPGNPAGALGDTSSITTWPAALRHVMRAVSQSEDLQRRIRWLIQRQHDHEKQWWQGREALLKKQRARVDKKKELDKVLLSVGAPVDNTKQISTAEEDEAELKRYDIKVYRASKKMAEAMVGELCGLHIPFFSIQPDLVDSSSKRNSPKPPTGGLLTTDELSGLQRRMLELLQDLCKE